MARVLIVSGLLAGIVLVGAGAHAEPASRPVTRIGLLAAVQRALARNPGAVAAQAEIARAEALVRQARASSLPSLTANLTFTRLDGDRKRGELVVAEANTLNANLQLSVPLVHGQRWVQWRNARANVEVARAGADDVRRQLAATAARACLTIVAQHRAVEVNERARDTAREHLAFARQRFAGGAGNRIDVVRAASEVSVDEAQTQVAQGGLLRAQEALGVVLAADGPLDCDGASLLASAPALRDALKALARRGDLRASEARLLVARKAVRDSWTDFLPYLTAVFQPFYQDPPSLMQPQTGWQLQLLLTVPLYDGGLRYGQQRERRAQLAAVEAQLEGLARQARSEVRAAFAVMRQADKALAAAREAARLGQEAYTLANKAYQAGATTSLEILDAGRRARDAETAAVVAEDNARQARLDLLVASGRFP
jgi:outer membrane protein TolC